MNSTFGDIKDAIRSNLDDAGITFYSPDDVTNVVQEIYSDIAFQSQCIVKKTTLPFQANVNYYNLAEQVEDYLTTLAIFNTNTNRWLFDHVTLRQMDNFRIDWELWTQTPQFWCPVSFDIIAIVPHYAEVPAQTFDLLYAATAPLHQDLDTPLIAIDFQSLIEQGAMAELLEQAEEFIKARAYHDQYVKDLEDYRERVHRLAKRDLLLRK